MSARAAMLQGLLAGLMLASMAVFGWKREAVGLLALALLLILAPVLLGRSARQRPIDDQGPKPVSRSDQIMVGCGFCLFIAPALAAAFIPGAAQLIDISKSSHRAVVLAMLIIGAVAVFLVFLSTLIDWFYVRPHLRGGCGTICATSLEGQWRGVTRIWLMHRAVATYGAIAGATALAALAANSWVRPIDETVAGAIAAVATIIAGYYLTRAAPLLAIAINPPVQVGDVIEIAEEFNVHEPGRLREYFVVDVALEGVKLLQVGEGDVVGRTGPDARRTHDRTVDVMEISRLLRRRRPVKPCRPGCQKLSEYCACGSAWLPTEENAALAEAPEPA